MTFDKFSCYLGRSMARRKTRFRKMTLVISPRNQPIRAIRWEDAIKLRYEGLVDVLVEYDEEVKSPSVTWRMPAVVRLRKLDKKDIRKIRYKRDYVLERDGYGTPDGLRCQYCRAPLKKKEATIDHVNPRARGGHSDYTNVVVACEGCNKAKGRKTCDEWGKFPIKTPKAPEKVVFPRVMAPQESIPDEWVGYARIAV